MYGENFRIGVAAANIPEETMESIGTEEQLAEAPCFPIGEAQDIEQEERSAESCAIYCNSCGPNIQCQPYGPCSVINENVDVRVLCCLCDRNRSIQIEQRESNI